MSDRVPEALVRCVGDVDRFLEDAWTRRPHLRRRSGDDTFQDLLSIDDVDRILTTTSPRAPAFRLVRDGRTLPRSSYTRRGTLGGSRLDDLPDVGRVLAAFDEGATIVLQGLHRYWEPVTRFCRQLELFLTHPVQANAYLTPPVAAGLRVHHDTHDVFALQTHGHKQWVTFAPLVEQPLASQGWSSDLGEVGDPELDTSLEPGDCLYLPRGTPHAARTVDRPSLHLTIGLRSTTWHDLLNGVLDAAAEDIRLREALPVGYAHDPEAFAGTVADRLQELADWVRERDPGDLARDTADRFWSGRQPPLRGQLLQLLEVDAIGPDTTIARRPDTAANLRVDGDRLEVRLGDRTITVPAAVEPAVRHALDAGRLTVDELRGLDADSRIVLARRLVREGLFVIVS